MAARRIGIIAAVVLLAAAVTYGAYRLVCADSTCRGASGTAAGTDATKPPQGGGVVQTPGGTASTAPGSPAGSPAFSAPPGPRRADRLQPGQRLNRGELLISPDGRFTLRFQESDGNLVIYEDGKTAVWHLEPNRDASYLINQPDGNLVLARQNGTPIWDSGTAGRGSLTLYLFDDGNLVLLDPKERKVWETGSSVNS